MPRGAKIDRQATKQGRLGVAIAIHDDPNGRLFHQRLTDRRSFVTTKGHVKLYGRDMGVLRERVYSENPHCSECGVLTTFDAHLVDPLRAELAHIVSRGQLGCDCRHNVQIKCRRHHRGPEGEHA